MKHGFDGADLEQAEGTVTDGVATLRERERIVLTDGFVAQRLGWQS
jgi:hypothetical protein